MEKDIRVGDVVKIRQYNGHQTTMVVTWMGKPYNGARPIRVKHHSQWGTYETAFEYSEHDIVEKVDTNPFPTITGFNIGDIIKPFYDCTSNKCKLKHDDDFEIIDFLGIERGRAKIEVQNLTTGEYLKVFAEQFRVENRAPKEKRIDAIEIF